MIIKYQIQLSRVVRFLTIRLQFWHISVINIKKNNKDTEKTKCRTIRVMGFLSSPSLTWVSSVQACDAAGGGAAIFRCHMATLWGGTCNYHDYFMFIGSSFLTCHSLLSLFIHYSNAGLNFELISVLNYRTAWIDISRVIEICTQWVKLGYTCTSFIMNK